MPEKIAVLEKGVKETDIDVTVDDHVYEMQDKYELPYTTVDEAGNTTVSVVERVELSPPVPEFPERDFMQARLHVKVFKNTTISVTGIAATGNETCPRSRGFLDTTVSSLEHNMGSDRYLRNIYNALERKYDRIPRLSTASPITSLAYEACDDDAGTATSAATYLRPYHHDTAHNSSMTIYHKWNVDQDSVYTHHLKYWYGKDVKHTVFNVAELMKDILRTRIAPAAKICRTELGRTNDIREIRARQTLKRLIGEIAYAKYACRGFITFKGESGITYQIFPGHGRVTVWNQGKQVEQLCVILTGDFPPTDSLIMRLLLIQESEDRFKKIANVFPSYAPNLNRAVEKQNPVLSLPEIFADLKIKQINQMRELLVA